MRHKNVDSQSARGLIHVSTVSDYQMVHLKNIEMDYILFEFINVLTKLCLSPYYFDTLFVYSSYSLGSLPSVKDSNLRWRTVHMS